MKHLMIREKTIEQIEEALTEAGTWFMRITTKRITNAQKGYKITLKYVLQNIIILTIIWANKGWKQYMRSIISSLNKRDITIKSIPP